jgi:ribosomal protein S21
MGVKVVVREGESVVAALRRLKKMLGRQQPRFHNRREAYNFMPGEVRRRKRNNHKWVAQVKEAAKRLATGADSRRG